MKRMTTIMAVAMMFSIGLWVFDPSQSFAQKSTGKAGMSGGAHVSGVVIGKEIRNERGVVLGTVENVVLNDSGCAQYVVLSGKLHGAQAKLYPIPWTVIARTGPDAILVDLDPAFLEEAPSFEVNRWPDFSQGQWQTEIRTFYEKRAQGATSGQGGKTSSTVQSEDKTKTERDLKANQEQWRKPAAEGTVPKEKSKEKGSMEKQRQHKSSEMGTQSPAESSKQKDMDIKAREHKPEKSGMTERGGKTEMMERGKMQMMDRERQDRDTQTPSVPGAIGTPSGPSQTERDMR